MPKVLTQAQIDQFREQGFVSPIRVMSDAEALGYRSGLERFERETGGPLGGNRRHKTRLCHGNSNEHTLSAKASQASCSCDSALPMHSSLGSEATQCGSGDQVALKVEGVVNGGVHAEKALGGSSRLEALQLALASSHCLMRVFRPIVIPQPLLMQTGKPETPER